MRTRAVLWDLDGTLIDSMEQHWLAWLDVLEDEGIRITREQFIDSFGRRNATILPQWLGVEPGSPRVELVGGRKEQRYRERLLEGGCTVLPGALEWLDRLERRGWRQAIASSAPRLNVEAVIAALGIGPYFSATVAAEDVPHGKPQPDVFLTAAERLGAEPARSVVVEDAVVGFEAARRAGIPCVAVCADSPAGTAVWTRSLADLPEDTFDRIVSA